ncbi:hypothetical protein [Alicyclobacillus sendaiensis]|uniref:hypothetical protein n=1 Tax=Alicyclobacillus sendaiensis TaxID=192387 RepID=UPI000785D35E|nr:hypothetical protein [Alicyclobacillus sendaiensis]
MPHPLYPIAKQYVGRPVIVYHVNGRRYHGILHSVRDHGIYLLNVRPIAHSAGQAEERFSTLNEAQSGDIETVYAPVAYFAFGALTGLTLGTALGATIARPYPYYGYGYGYGYGYPGYWW